MSVGRKIFLAVANSQVFDFKIYLGAIELLPTFKPKQQIWALNGILKNQIVTLILHGFKKSRSHFVTRWTEMPKKLFAH